MPADSIKEDKLNELKKKIEDYAKESGKKQDELEQLPQEPIESLASEMPDQDSGSEGVEEKKGIYQALEEAWYGILDKINTVIPVYSIVDPIDKIVPSFVVFIISAALLLIILIAGGFLFFGGNILPFGQVEYLFVVLDEDGNPLSGVDVALIASGQTYPTQSHNLRKFRRIYHCPSSF